MSERQCPACSYVFSARRLVCPDCGFHTDSGPPPRTEMRSAGWTIRRAGQYIEVEDPRRRGAEVQPDTVLFRYFDALLKENGL